MRPSNLFKFYSVQIELVSSETTTKVRIANCFEIEEALVFFKIISVTFVLIVGPFYVK